MNNETTNDETIERYRDGLMSPNEREEFERRLESDEKLRRSLRIEEAMTMAIAIDRATAPNRHTEMRARAVEAISRIAPAATVAAPVAADELIEKRNGSGRRRGLYFSGLAALLLGIGGWLLLRPTEPTPVTRSAPAVSAPAAASQSPLVSSPTTGPATPAAGVDQAKDDRTEVMSMRGGSKDSGAASAVRSSKRLPSSTARANEPAAARRQTEQPTAISKPERKTLVIKDPKASAPVSLEQK
jgi:hypothetical protein